MPFIENEPGGYYSPAPVSNPVEDNIMFSIQDYVTTPILQTDLVIQSEVSETSVIPDKVFNFDIEPADFSMFRIDEDHFFAPIWNPAVDLFQTMINNVLDGIEIFLEDVSDSYYYVTQLMSNIGSSIGSTVDSIVRSLDPSNMLMNVLSAFISPVDDTVYEPAIDTLFTKIGDLIAG